MCVSVITVLSNRILRNDKIIFVPKTWRLQTESSDDIRQAAVVGRPSTVILEIDNIVSNPPHCPLTYNTGRIINEAIVCHKILNHKYNKNTRLCCWVVYAPFIPYLRPTRKRVRQCFHEQFSFHPLESTLLLETTREIIL